MGKVHLGLAALVLSSLFTPVALAAPESEEEAYLTLLETTTRVVPTVKETFQIPVVRSGPTRTEFVGGANGRPAEQVYRTGDPTIAFQPHVVEFQKDRKLATDKLGSAVAVALKESPTVDQNGTKSYQPRFHALELEVKDVASKLNLSGKDKDSFVSFAKEPRVQALLRDEEATSSPAHDNPDSESSKKPIAAFNSARENLASQYTAFDDQQRAQIQQITAQATSELARQQALANQQKQREDFTRRQAEESARQAAADEAARNGGGNGGGGSGGTGGGKGAKAGEMENPNFNIQPVQPPKSVETPFDPSLFNRPASRGISSIDSGAINPVSISNQPVLPKAPPKGFAEKGGGESLKFNMPSVKGGPAGSAIQNAGIIPASNATLGDSGSSPNSGVVGASNSGADGATSGDPYANNGNNKQPKAASYNLVKDGKYGEVNGSGGSDGDGDGEETVDGGGDGGSVGSSKNLFKEVLTPVAIAKNGPRGVFGYMGLIRTICASPRGQLVGVCGSTRVPASPRVTEAELTVALAAGAR